MFKKVGLVVLLVVALLFTGCGGSTAENNDGEVAKIGILQLVEHPALDAAREGFLDGLKEAGLEEGKDIQVDYQNSQNDKSNLQTMAKKLVTDKNDLILAITTDAAIVLANETQEIPILITAVTDPLEAKLVESMEKPSTNVTGTTDMNPIDEQLDLILEVVPEVKSLGVIYNAGEINSQVQVKILKELAQAKGIENVVEATVTASSEVMQGAQSLVGRVDAIYVPTDNTAVSAYATIVQVAEENKIPLFAGEARPIEQGGVGTFALDYYELGKQTALMAVRVLEGENPGEMAIETQKDPQLIINKSGAERLEITISEELLTRADKIIEEN
ncbi:MAG: ABC transporter substrate-binding protein [Clostridia bacterium]|jgi:putative ABC transport system substrate-binding protein|nr:ABC transporter substrate-binding protein [Clostridia bacterium]